MASAGPMSRVLKVSEDSFLMQLGSQDLKGELDRPLKRFFATCLDIDSSLIEVQNIRSNGESVLVIHSVMPKIFLFQFGAGGLV